MTIYMTEADDPLVCPKCGSTDFSESHYAQKGTFLCENGHDWRLLGYDIVPTHTDLGEVKLQ